MVVTTGSGTLTASFTVPDTAAAGSYDVSAQVGATTLTATNFEVVSNATITSLLPNPAAPGSTVTLSGIDFPVGTTVTAIVTCNPGSTQVTGTVDSTGQLSLSFQVPSSAMNGTCQVQVQEGGVTLTSASLQVQATATITLNSSTVPAGGSVTVSGTGLLPSTDVTAQVTVTLTGGGTQNVSQVSVTDGSGNVSLTLSIPGNALPGSYAVGVYQNGSTTASATATLTVTQAATIQLVPSTQVPGTGSTVAVTGTGFGANETVTVGYLATLTTGGQQQISVTGQSDSSGTISVSLPVPVTVAGNMTYTVTAAGQTSGLTATAELIVSLNPQLSATPSTVTNGGTVSISGEQFPPSATGSLTAQIPLTNGGTQPISQTIQVASDGTFTAQVAIPANASSSSVTFSASAVAPTSGQTYTASTTVTIIGVPASISLSSASAVPGEQLTATGAGFALGPGALITLVETFDTNIGQQSQTQTIDASSSGTFTTVFMVPAIAISGTATITATQVSSGDTASTTLAIEAPTPTPTSTPTSTPTATPTATPIPATPTSTSVPSVPVHLKIKSASLWYRIVRAGTFNHVEIRTNKKMRLPVIMRVTYPEGITRVYTGFTDIRGIWTKTFPVPANATNRSGTLALIQIIVTRNFVATTTLRFVLIT
jgi:hypothetical protein